MFTKTAAFYDAVYAFKDYVWECERLRGIIKREAPQARTLLDIACGTGMHLGGLKKFFECEGMDVDPNMLAICRARNPGQLLHLGDMSGFSLGKRYDVVLCLFSSIGYLPDATHLDAAAVCMARHLTPGGLLIVEPWLTPEAFQNHHLGSLFVDKDDLKIARINLSRIEGRQSVIDFHYLIGTPAGIESAQEEHRLTLFTDEEYVSSFEKAGLSVARDSEGLTGRGLFLARASQES